MTELLTIEDLCIHFGEDTSTAPALQRLNLSIRAGAFLGLVGESGSGKSITALSILRLLPRSGSIRSDGKIWLHERTGNRTNLLALPTKQFNVVRGKRIGMVFQEPMTALNPLLTCGEQITEVIQRHLTPSLKEAKKQALEWMQRVQLPDPVRLYDRYPHELSGGQKQRIGIAAAICCGPDLLICDEPTTALDVTVQKEILDLIRAEQIRSGMAVLFISHDLALVSQYADQVAVLYQGELVEHGPCPEIFSHPKHPYTRALIGCRPAAHKRGERLPHVSDFLEPGAPLAVKPGNVPLATPATEAWLRIERLSIGYPTKQNRLGRPEPVVHSADFEIFKGEMLGLVGESGSGKTSLGRALLGLTPPLSGSIWYRNTDLAKLDHARWPIKRHQLQLVFQDPYASLNPRIPIGEAIGEPLRVHRKVSTRREERQRVREWLERVQLNPDQIDRYPHEFSGGQRQRIVIARALALEPDFVVCDESVSALDVSIQAQVLNLLNDLRRELSFTCLFISHDLGVVRFLCDRMIVLKQGRIVESGQTEEVCTHPKDPYTQNLLQCIPQLESVT